MLLTYFKKLSVQPASQATVWTGGGGHCGGSRSTCQLIDGVEGASLDRHCRSAPPSRQRAPSCVTSLMRPRLFAAFMLFFSPVVFKVQRLLHWTPQIPQVCLEWMWQVALLLCFGPPEVSSSTSITCATQHKRLALQIPLSSFLPWVFNKSPTVFKRNRQVSEWQITPMHRQAQDDNHGKLTTGRRSCNLPVESNGEPLFFFFRDASGSRSLIDCH